MRVFVIDWTVCPSYSDTLFLAIALGARIVYTTDQLDHARVRGDLLLAGLPVLPIVTCKATHTPQDVAFWISMQRKCVFVDATLATLTMPLIAFSDVNYFVMVNWQARQMESMKVKQVLSGCGMRLCHVDGDMLRFRSEQNRVVDVYLNVHNITDILDKLSGFTDLFLTERLPGPELTCASAAHVQLGSTTDATFQGENWLSSAVHGYVLLTDSMQQCTFNNFNSYKETRDKLVAKAVSE